MPTLMPTTAGLQAARSDARALCEQHAVEANRGEDFVLVVSELISNSMLHGRPPRAYEVSLDQGDLFVTVDDADRVGPPAPLSAGDDAEGGRGLAIVQALARLWGWLPTVTGKRVWARV